MSGEPGDPVISIVKGNPTPEEIAAVVLVLAASDNQRSPREAGSPRSQWAAYWHSLRTPIAPGPGAWRQSARG